MGTRYPIFPDDLSNQFGEANSLDTAGGVFDTYQNQNVQTMNTAPSQPSQSEDASLTQEETPAAIPPSEQTEADSSAMESREEAPSSAASDAPKKKAPGNRGGGLKWTLLLTMMAFCVIALGAFLYINTHAILGDLFGKHQMFSSDETEVDLSGSDYKDYSPIARLKSLETVDLTHTPVKDLSFLYGCQSLKKVVLLDRVLTAAECIDFFDHVPGAHLVCRVDINGQVYDSETAQLSVENADAGTQALFAALNRLVRLDLTGCDVSDDTYKALSEKLPGCMVLINVELCGQTYRTDADSIVLKGEITQEDADRLNFFKNLRTMDVRQCTSTELVSQIIASHPDVKLNEPIVFLGHSVGTEDELVDLRGSRYTFNEVKAGLDEVLPKMNSLKKIDMCGCGLSDSEMEKLTKAYPDIKFVWMVHFRKWYVRTDAVAFSTLNSEGKSVYTQDDYAPLFKYCTDLVALDLGHSRITDISGIASMKNLRAVILTDNKIKNISAFAKLEKLEFIEMNATNKVKSVEPLRKLQNLKYINLWGSMDITDLSPLYNHENLEIVIFERTTPKDEQERFRSSNPNCATFFKVDSNKTTTNETWRSNPYRRRLKERVFRSDREFYNWKYVVGFDEETGEYILDYNTDQYKYK